MKYVRKPVVVDAVQWLKDGDHPLVMRIADGVHVLHTPDTAWHVRKGDWIITEESGECFPCPPDVFARLYEPVWPIKGEMN